MPEQYKFILPIFQFFGCFLIEFGLAIYQKRKISMRNLMAFYTIKGGVFAIWTSVQAYNM